MVDIRIADISLVYLRMEIFNK